MYEAKYDLNNDGVVDDKDLQILYDIISHKITGPPALITQADFNGDGQRNAQEITMMEMHYGSKPSLLRAAAPWLFFTSLVAGSVILGKREGRYRR